MSKLALRTLFAVLTVTSACGGKGEDSATDADGSSALSAEDAVLADALWSSISGYDGWAQAGDWQGIQPSDDGTHGTHVQIWVNSSTEYTLDEAAGGDMPDGAILVKEGYSDASGSTVNAITVMQKISGYDPDNGDWFYARYSASGEVTMAGQSAIALCEGCHAVGQDSLRAYTW